MPYPSIRSSNYGVCGDATSRHTVQYPATIVAGDILLFALTSDADEIAGIDGAWAGGGYKLVGTAASMAWGWKKADGTETGWVSAAATTDNSEPAYFVILCIKDAADPTVTTPSSGTAATGTDSTAELPALTGLTSTDWLAIGLWGNDHSDTINSWPANYPDNRLDSRGTGNGDAGQACATATFTGTAAPSGTLTLSGSEDWISQVIAVRYGAVAQTVTLGLLAAATLYAPEVRPEQPVTVPLLAATTLWAPTVKPSVTLPLLGAATLLEPTVIRGQLATLPLLLVGANNWGQYASFDGTADRVDSDYAAWTDGDLDVRAHVRSNDWTASKEMVVYGEWGTSTYAFDLYSTAAGFLALDWCETGGTTRSSSSTELVPATDGVTDLWVRAVLDVSVRTVKFYTAPDGVTWTQLGNTVSGAATSVRATAGPLYVGAVGDTGKGFSWSGRIYEAAVYRNEVLVANPKFSGHPWDIGVTSADDAQGNTWTLNGPAIAGIGPIRVISESLITLPLLGAATLLEPTVLAEQQVTLGLLAPTSLLEPVLLAEQAVTLPLLGGAGAGVAPTVVQAKTAADTGTKNLAVTFPAPTTAGNTILLLIGYRNDATWTPPTAGWTYEDTQYAWPFDAYWCYRTSVGEQTITFTDVFNGGWSAYVLAAFEISGWQGKDTDGHAYTGPGENNTSQSAGSATNAVADSLLLALVGVYIDPESDLSGEAWSNSFSAVTPTDVSNYKAYGAHKTVSASASQTTTLSWTEAADGGIGLILIAKGTEAAAGLTTLYGPAVENTVTLGLLAAATLLEPVVVTESLVTLPLLGAATLWAPTVKPTVTLPLLGAATLWAPGVYNTYHAHIAANADDCFQDSAWNTGTLQLDMGRGGYDNNAWLRFDDVPIPRGSTVYSLILTGYSYSTVSTTTVNLRCFLEDADDPTMPTSVGDADGRTMTENYADWDDLPAWTIDQPYSTPNFAAAGTEVFARPGWNSGQAIQAVVKNNGSTVGVYRHWLTLESDGTEVSITILYVPPTGPQDVTLPLLTAASLLAPGVRLEQDVVLGLLAPASLLAPAVECTVTLPLLGAATLLEPTVLAEQQVTLGLLAPASLLALAVENTVTLPQLAAATLLEPTVATPEIQTVTLGLLETLTAWAPTARLTVALDQLAAAALLEPVLTFGDQYLTLGELTAVVLWAPAVQVQVVLPGLAPVSLAAPALNLAVTLPRQATLTILEPTVSLAAALGLLSPVTLWAPAVLREQVLTLDLLAAATLWAPAASLTVSLGTLGALTLHPPVVRREGVIALDQLAAAALLEPVLTFGDQYLTLETLATAALLAPTVFGGVSLDLLAALTLWAPVVAAEAVLVLPAALQALTLHPPVVSVGLVEQDLTLELLVATSLAAPALNLAVSLGTLAATVLYPPTARLAAELPLLAAAVLYQPTLRLTLSLGALAATSLYAPAVAVAAGQLTLPLLAAAALHAPAVQQVKLLQLETLQPLALLRHFLWRTARTNEGGLDPGDQAGGLSTQDHAGRLTHGAEEGQIV